ncbi:MAG: hypothetical protein CL609_09550 [Anaerolineaceae bacterium]|nr:hypothetical protein [Anaerolineaceae bacterium]
MNNKPQLATGYSDALEELLKTNAAPIQAIEFGPYNAIETVKERIHSLTNYKLYYHPGSWIRFLNWQPEIKKKNQIYLEILKPPWASFHIVLKPAWGVWLAQHNFRFAYKRKKNQEQKFIKKINQLKNDFSCPIMLEHMPGSAPNDRLECASEVIQSIVSQTESLFLLDIPHAIITAQILGMPVDKYLKSLPLQKTREIHISGPRYRGAYLSDVHDTIGENELYWLQWVLDQTQADVVTLEYYRNAHDLAVQLEKLAKILGY